MSSSWRIEKAYQREEDLLVESFNSGELTQKQYNEQMRELHAQMRDELRDAEREEMDDARDRFWGGL